MERKCRVYFVKIFNFFFKSKESNSSDEKFLRMPDKYYYRLYVADWTKEITGMGLPGSWALMKPYIFGAIGAWLTWSNLVGLLMNKTVQCSVLYLVKMSVKCAVNLNDIFFDKIFCIS